MCSSPSPAYNPVSVVCVSRAAAGKVTLVNGDVYEGEFKDEKYNGRGEEEATWLLPSLLICSTSD